MSTAFKLSCAAQEAPQKVALVLDGASYSFARLWSLVEPVCGTVSGLNAVALEGQSRLAELTVLYACLECEVPVLLLHPSLQGDQQSRLVERVARIHRYDADAWVAATHTGGAELAERDAVLLSTSGSTGTPKIVRLSRAALEAAARSHALRTPFMPGDRWLLSLPFAHVGGLSILLRCLAARCGVVVSRAQAGSAAFSEVVEQQEVTLLSLVPTQLRRVLRQPLTTGKLRVILVGGAPCDAALRQEAADAGLPVVFTYGMTEAASQIATQEAGAAPAASGDGLPVGPCLDGFEVRIEKDRSLSVRGAPLFHGYLGQATSPFDAEGWFNTGDLVQLDQRGALTIQGRRDRLIISGGENVSPESVEAVIAGAGLVRSVAVVGLADHEWGERVVAAVEPLGESPPDWQVRLTRHCRERLARYEMPKDWVVFPKLPLLSNGKPDYSSIVGEVALRVGSTGGG